MSPALSLTGNWERSSLSFKTLPESLQSSNGKGVGLWPGGRRTGGPVADLSLNSVASRRSVNFLEPWFFAYKMVLLDENHL